MGSRLFVEHARLPDKRRRRCFRDSARRFTDFGSKLTFSAAQSPDGSQSIALGKAKEGQVKSRRFFTSLETLGATLNIAGVTNLMAQPVQPEKAYFKDDGSIPNRGTNG